MQSLGLILGSYPIKNGRPLDCRFRKNSKLLLETREFDIENLFAL